MSTQKHQKNPPSFAGQEPFAMQYSEQVPELLAELGCSLSLSTYQIGKLILISSDGEKLTQLLRDFPRAMGIALKGEQLALSCENEIIVTRNSPKLARLYPQKPDTYDVLFCPVASYYTGYVDMHDLCWAGDELIGVNTRFSCLCRIGNDYHFSPIWQPPFISKLESTDRCHLNGLSLVEGKAKYVTALGQSDSAGGWREQKYTGGILMDVEKNEILLEGLAAPHSPRYYKGELYLLLSASGELIRYEAKNKNYKVINRFPGFVRGLAFCQDYIFVGLSRFRANDRTTFGDFPRDPKSLECGVTILHRKTGSVVGEIRYLNLCEEIYDLTVLEGIRRPNILNTADPTYKNMLILPEDSFWLQEKSDGAQQKNK